MSINSSHKIETPKEKQIDTKPWTAIKVINTLKDDFKNPIDSMNYFYTLFEEVYCKTNLYIIIN